MDDDPISLQIHRSMLERDYMVDAYERAEDALQAIEASIRTTVAPGLADGTAPVLTLSTT